LGRVLLKDVKSAFQTQLDTDRQWQELHYKARPDFKAAIREYEEFTAILRQSGADLHFLQTNPGTGLDSIYTRDASVVCAKGAILCNMGKPLREEEPAACQNLYSKLQIPVLGQIESPGKLEGGDVTWLAPRIMAVGQGYRTNSEGIEQLKAQLGNCIDELIEVPLPHWNGPEDVFHLMSVLSPIDEDLALVYSRLLPVPFRDRLLDLGYQLVDVPDEEFESMGCNVLALSDRRCLMLEGNSETRRRLETAGAEVYEYSGFEISRKGEGGPTCLTRPIRDG
jgi:N-dimethylarginine dimethylaminohydrolase